MLYFLRSDAGFTSPFTFILSMGTPIGTRSNWLAEIRVTPTGNGAVFTATRAAALPPPLPTSHLTNFDAETFTLSKSVWQCVCLTSATGCQNCFSTRRPPFGPGPPPDGTGGPLRRELGPTPAPTQPAARQHARTFTEDIVAKSSRVLLESNNLWLSFLPHWLCASDSATEREAHTKE